MAIDQQAAGTQLVLHPAHGVACIVMDSPSIGADPSWAWWTNEIAATDAESVADVVLPRRIAAAGDSDASCAAHAIDYRDELMHPYRATESGPVGDIVNPAETRVRLVDALAMLSIRIDRCRPVNAVAKEAVR